MSYAKVQDQPGLVRDESTNQIINTNVQEYEQYLARRKARKSEKEKQMTVETDLDTMKSDLDGLKGEIGEIKSLLKELVNGN